MKNLNCVVLIKDITNNLYFTDFIFVDNIHTKQPLITVNFFSALDDQILQ